MFITTRNNYTKITKDIYMMKVLSSTEDTVLFRYNTIHNQY